MATLRTVPRAGGQESYIVCYTPRGERKRSKTFRDRAEAEAFANEYGGWGRGVTGPIRRPLAERLWERVDKGGPDECWTWQGSLNKENGYGSIGVGGHASPTVYVHRASYELAHGPIADGLLVRHKCDNPPCVNPAHLELGTYQDNTNDMLERRGHYLKKRTCCANGHEFTPENTRHYTSRKGHTRRVCRKCERAAYYRKSSNLQRKARAS